MTDTCFCVWLQKADVRSSGIEVSTLRDGERGVCATRTIEPGKVLTMSVRSGCSPDMIEVCSKRLLVDNSMIDIMILIVICGGHRRKDCAGARRKAACWPPMLDRSSMPVTSFSRPAALRCRANRQFNAGKASVGGAVTRSFAEESFAEESFTEADIEPSNLQATLSSFTDSRGAGVQVAGW